MAQAKFCSVPDCDQPYAAKGYCQMHYARWKRHGDPGVVLRPRGTPSALCSIAGCEKPHYAFGWCPMHYTRWRTYGDPLQAQYERTGPGNTVEIPRYETMHRRLAKLKTGRCSTPGCTRTNTQMALRHGCGHLVNAKSKYGTLYSTRVEDYFELCARCHVAYDRGSIAKC